MGCCSQPSPPDPVATAQAQGAANAEAARVQGTINNPNVINPYGSQTVTWNGDQPTVTQTLSPEERAIFDREQANRLGLQDLAGTGLESLSGIIGQGVDFSGLPAAGTAYRGGPGAETLDYSRLPALRSAFTMPGDLPEGPQSYEGTRSRVIDALMSRQNQGFAQREDQVNSDLIARGIRPGTEAYAREMERIDQARNDAYLQAEGTADSAIRNAFEMDAARRAAAFGEDVTASQLGFGQQAAIFDRALGAQGQRFGQQTTNEQMRQSGQNQTFSQQDALRRQAITELLAQRQIPLNEITALMSGAQVQNPFSTPGYAQNANVAPAPIAALTSNNYNQQVGNYNNMLSGLFGLGSAGIGLSDIRLKSNIERVGTHPLGIGIYEYDIFDRRERGVIAQEVLEVMPEAVISPPGGYLMVDYAKIGWQ